MRFREHVEFLKYDELVVEKEKLKYHIEYEQKRKERLFQKLNLFVVISVAIIPVSLTLFEPEKFFQAPLYFKVISLFLVYALIYVGILVYLGNKTVAIRRSKFSDLRGSLKKTVYIVEQYYYDWQQIRLECDYFARYMSVLQEWFIFLMCVFILFSVSSILNKS